MEMRVQVQDLSPQLVKPQLSLSNSWSGQKGACSPLIDLARLVVGIAWALFAQIQAFLFGGVRQAGVLSRYEGATLLAVTARRQDYFDKQDQPRA